MESSTIRRPRFMEENDGLASLAQMKAEFSGNSHHHNQNHPFFSRASCYSTIPNRRSSLRNLSLSSDTFSSPRFGRVYCEARFEELQPHFLEACFLCKEPLGENRDIFMYRGDMPFCSEECREEQIEIDEAKEKNKKSWNLYASMKALRSKNDPKKSSSSSSSATKNQSYRCRAGTVAAA
ncbi:hypothetical protein Nepgr_030662 [Nepenthes gracilis]|uniref:FLZ-type domain-containing protein n=1 Tax=Nepenthes gracilis TaxID=150966 RepID=A0AAD3TGQ5_NEPGR|nr:hypothetical protein Nepgr_030662 [Nepenthes gracilis]